MHGKVFVTQTGKYLSTKGANTQSKKFLPPKSICVSCIATLELVILTSEKSQTNQQINSVIPKDYCKRSRKLEIRNWKFGLHALILSNRFIPANRSSLCWHSHKRLSVDSLRLIHPY